MTTSSVDFSKIKEVFGKNRARTSINQSILDDTKDKNVEDLNNTSDILVLNEGDVQDIKFSQEERKVLINKIIQKKKRGRGSVNGIKFYNNQEQNENNVDSDSDEVEMHDDESVSTIAGELSEAYSYHIDGMTSDSDNNRPYEKSGMRRSHSDAYLMNNADNGMREQKRYVSQTPTRHQSFVVPSSSFYKENFNHTSKSYSDNPFTFKPMIKQLPDYYGKNKMADAPFYDRITKWQKDKELNIYRKKVEKEHSVLSDCSFHPRININSQKAIQEIRQSKNGLYLNKSTNTLTSPSNNDPIDSNQLNDPTTIENDTHNTTTDVQSNNINKSHANMYAMMLAESSGESAHERLYRTNQFLLEQKMKLLQQEMERERQEESYECTFQPQLITDQSKFHDIQSKYNRDMNQINSSFQQILNSDGNTQNLPKDCTFTPKVQGLKPSMKSAKKYVTTPVVDRLTQPMTIEMTLPPPKIINTKLTTSAMNSARNSIASSSRDMQSDMISLSGRSDITTHSRILAFNPQLRHSSDVADDSVLPTRTSRQQQQQLLQNGMNPLSRRRAESVPPGRRISMEELEIFNSRMNQSEIRKNRRIEEVKRSITPSFKPEITPHTNQIVSNRYSHNSNNDFINRMEQYLLRKQDVTARNQLHINNIINKDLTFQPTITKKSERLQARSVYELSKGDLIRKETNQHMLKLRTEQEKLEGMTFHPQLSKKALNSHSVLKLNEDPNYHLEWKKNKIKKKQEYIRSEQEKKIQEELSECSFTPNTIDCPDYIKRIAKSMSIIKNSRSSFTMKPEKVDWK